MDAEKTSKVAKCPQNNLNNYYCTWIKKINKNVSTELGAKHYLMYTHTTVHCVYNVQGSSLIWQKPRPRSNLPFRALSNWIICLKKTWRWREQMAFSCLTLSIWCFFFPSSGRSVDDITCPSVVAEVLKEASRWKLWHWRGGDMTLYGFCVSFLPVPVYGLTMRSPTSRLQTYDFRGMTNKRVLFQYGIKEWSFKGKVTVFFCSLWLCV